MITSGLVSVTFRELSPSEIVRLTAKAGMDGIEWGGDIHVPPGQITLAREVYQMTADAGLKALSYGSYYRVGEKEEKPFEAILETASELHTRVIRVWAGRRASAEADQKYWEHVINESRRIAELARAKEMTIAYEFHGGTLADTDETAVRLVKEVAHPHMKSYWQIPMDRDAEASLNAVLPWLVNIHVFFYKKLYLTMKKYIFLQKDIDGLCKNTQKYKLGSLRNSKVIPTCIFE